MGKKIRCVITGGVMEDLECLKDIAMPLLHQA
jgi:hypothetical protein